jgi:hypothetical protein
MSTIKQKFNADTSEEFYILTKPHLNEMFPAYDEIQLSDLTWHDIGKVILNTKNCAKYVVKFPKGIKDTHRKEIIETFGVHKVICEENKVLCVNETDASFIKMKYC